ncbi:hypothetical protein QBC46DRAFT_412127 [Diplogelasinospora grovesii]|uniref:Uncharacterized protein n=1 Tax=Diplogelasinospora grovesii TaxID=303347 RepID=A0AAN6S0A3_9PEZI|nr:hypothetical protein QBC46DRAFT_412127 [Diplogelasinospora grovesii]
MPPLSPPRPQIRAPLVFTPLALPFPLLASPPLVPPPPALLFAPTLLAPLLLLDLPALLFIPPPHPPLVVPQLPPLLLVDLSPSKALLFAPPLLAKPLVQVGPPTVRLTLLIWILPSPSPLPPNPAAQAPAATCNTREVPDQDRGSSAGSCSGKPTTIRYRILLNQGRRRRVADRPRRAADRSVHRSGGSSRPIAR